MTQCILDNILAKKKCILDNIVNRLFIFEYCVLYLIMYCTNYKIYIESYKILNLNENELIRLKNLKEPT